MRKRIIIGLTLFSLVFLAGGIYIIVTIEKTTSSLDRLITLHQVEILREHLLIHIKRVQADLNLKNTLYARTMDTIVKDVENMSAIANSCTDCHHRDEVLKRLNDLKDHVEKYTGLISRVLTLRADTARLAGEEMNAFRAGEAIVEEVNAMITMASMKLEEKTNAALRVMRATKYVLFGLVALAPLLAAGLGFVFIRAFTKPLKTVLDATRRLRGGDLDHRITGLTDECGEVAESFNAMAGSLKEHLHKVAESEKRYRMLFESAGDAIFILEGEGEGAGRIVEANQAAAKMHGYAVEDLLSLKITDLDTPEAAREAPGRISRILDGEWIHAEMNHVKRDGTFFPVEVSAGLLELGDHKYILAIDRDVTERRRAEEALQRAEQMKMVGELAAGLAHEIKNPLAGIKTSMEVLLGEAALPDEDRGVLTRVVGEINRIESLLRSLLNFARPPKPQFSMVKVHEILDTALSFSFREGSPPPGQKQITVERDFDSHLPETTADPMQLKQVFLNLFLNAGDAMPDGGTLRVKTLYDAPMNSIKIEVADRGKGISREEMGSIFRPFYSTKAKGTGLGLAIAKRLVEEHKGTITVESNPGEGTMFTVTLPVRQEGSASA